VDDPDHRNDISKAHPELVATLTRRIDEWRSATGPVLRPERGSKSRGGGE
jgi:hypothetical protein